MNLSEKEAFKAMYLFLDKYYKETSADDIGGLLGEISILPDGGTADPAAWEDWIKCLQKVKEQPEETDEFIKLKFIR